MKPITCSKCGNELAGGEDFRFCGISGADLFKMIRWLQVNNATVADLENSTLNYKYWNKQKILDAMFEQ